MTGHTLTIATRNEKRFVAVRRYRAECSCKWAGEWRRSREDAVQDGYAHQASVRVEAA